MVASILLLLLVFIAGLFTTNLPTKKFFAWFLFTIKKNSSNFQSCEEKGIMDQKRSSTPSGNNNSKNDEIIKRVFATFDKNSDGYITKQELRVSLKNIGMAMEDKEIEDLIKNVDANGDGLIDMNEFRDSFEMLLNRGEEKEVISSRYNQEDVIDKEEEEEKDLLQEAFDVFDEDKDGLITVEELGLVLSSMGFQEACKLEDCKKMIGSVDIDGDGMVNFDEFKKMMGNGQGFVSLS